MSYRQYLLAGCAVLALGLAMSAQALADGGAGSAGNRRSGAGGYGINGSGVPTAPGGAGAANASEDGGDGAHGLIGIGLPTSPTQGSNGGDGANGPTNYGNGDGGDGGWGAVVTGSDELGTLGVDVTGGDGGNGGSGYYAGNGGSGGIGLYFDSGDFKAVIIDAAIQGGNGGTGGTNMTSYGGQQGQGGVGIVGENLEVVVTKAGSIAGGLSGNGSTRANAITFTGGDNVLELQIGSNINGIVDASAGSTNTLRLGGGSGVYSGFFNLADIGSNAQYRGFNAFEKTGDTGLILIGSSSQTTDWSILSGDLFVGDGHETNDGHLNGDVAVSAGARLAFYNSSAFTYAGDVSGDGRVDHYSGTLTVTGDWTHTGGTELAGDLRIGNGGTTGSISGNITNAEYYSGRVIFDRSDAVAYGGIMSGYLSLIKLGGDVLTLTGENTYAGATTVSAGTLVVNGSIAGSATTVESGATLGGSGTLGAVTVESGAIFAPGNSIGTLNTGTYNLNAGGVLDVEINDGGFVAGTNNDLVNVTGAATLADGAIIRVASIPFGQDGSTFTPGRYTIVQASQTSSFGDLVIDENFAFLDFAYDFDATTLWLDSKLVAESFCLDGASANQCATGDGVFSLGAADPLYQQMVVMSDAEALAAQNALSGEIHASARSAFVQGAGLVRDAALNRVRATFDLYGGNDTPILSYAQGADIPAAHDRYSIWAHGFGGVTRLDGDGNAAGLDSHEGGFVAGVDAFVFDDWRAGLLAGYSRSSFKASARGSEGESDNAHLGLYGGTEFGRLGLRLGLANTWHFVDTERQALGESLEADYEARTFQAFGELGYRFDAGRSWVEPFVNAAYVGHRSDGFSETGGTAALDVAQGNSDTGFTTLGLRGALDVMFGATAATLHGTLGWRHAFGDIVPDNTHSFSNGSAFSISGTPIAEDTALIQAGIDFALSEAASFGISYSGQVSSDAHEHIGNAKVSVRF